MTTANARTATQAVRPVLASVEIDLPPARACEIFTQRMTDWWPIEYAMVALPRQIVIEAKAVGWGDLLHGFAALPNRG
jgi:hypothetical protein